MVAASPAVAPRRVRPAASRTPAPPAPSADAVATPQARASCDGARGRNAPQLGDECIGRSVWGCVLRPLALTNYEAGKQTGKPIFSACTIAERTAYQSGLDSPAPATYLFAAMLLRLRPPGFIERCLPSSAERPSSGANWIHEIKHDGCRLMARRDLIGTGIRLLTRNGNDWSSRYPQIVEALKVRSCLIDGEALACDGNGLAVFERLRRKIFGQTRPGAVRWLPERRGRPVPPRAAPLAVALATAAIDMPSPRLCPQA